MTIPTGMTEGPGASKIKLPDRRPVAPGKEDTTEPLPFATRLWDVLMVHGATKMGPALIKLADPYTQTAWKDYQRYHPEWHGKDGYGAVWEPARREYVERALEHGVRRGWLALDDKGFYTAVVSDNLPETESWKPITELALPESKTVVTYDYHMPVAWQPAIAERAYRDVGLSRADMVRAMKLRAKPDSAHLKALKESLRAVGQLYPIIRWPTSNSPADAEWIIVDGRTREELLLKICEEESTKETKGQASSACEPIKYLDLPASLPVVQVLALKIAAEMSGSTKTEQSRNDYIVELAKLGIEHSKIAEMVKLTRRRVTQIANAAGVARKGQIETHKAEILAMEADKWSIRAIAEETGFSKSVVHRALEAWAIEEPVPEGSSSTTRDKAVSKPAPKFSIGLPKPESSSAKALLTLVEDLGGQGTQRHIYETADLDQAQIAGSVNTWTKKGWVEPAGKAGQAKNYRVTPELIDLLHANQDWVDAVHARTPLAEVVTLTPAPDLHSDPTGEALHALLELLGMDRLEEVLTIMVAHGTDAATLSDRWDKLKAERAKP